MGNKVTVVKGDVTEVFEDVVGHQIGNGAVQILERNGNQRIINKFCDVSVELDDEASKNFAFEVAAMEAKGDVEVSDEEAERILEKTGIADIEGSDEPEVEYPEGQEDEDEDTGPTQH